MALVTNESVNYTCRWDDPSYQMDVEIAHNSGSGDARFDRIIGHIEDILMENEFQRLQQRFLDDYWHVFEQAEENKLEYMDIFNEYTREIEKYITGRLINAEPDFCTTDFLRELDKRRTQLDGEVFEVLATLTDFMAFKDMLLDYRTVKEGKGVDFTDSISVTSVKSANL